MTMNTDSSILRLLWFLWQTQSGVDCQKNVVLIHLSQQLFFIFCVHCLFSFMLFLHELHSFWASVCFVLNCTANSSCFFSLHLSSIIPFLCKLKSSRSANVALLDWFSLFLSYIVSMCDFFELCPECDFLFHAISLSDACLTTLLKMIIWSCSIED